MFGVLGPLRVANADGVETVLTGQRQRRLLSALLLNRGKVVSVDRLVEFVWDDDSWTDPAALQSLVFRLRQRISDLDLEYRAPGYILRAPDDRVDVAQFERLVLDATALRFEDPERASLMLDEASLLWRGDPYEDLVDADDGRVEIDRLTELRCRATEERFELQLDHGDAAGVIAEIEAFASRQPLREHPRHLLIRSYESLGRRADALRVYDAYRRLLADELGVAPSPELRQRHAALLGSDDVTLDPPPSAPSARSRNALRQPTSSFLGREELVATTVRGLSDSRLITLIGPGGVGKTRLATEIAHRLDGTGLEEVVFCDLTTATNLTVVDVVIAAAAVESRTNQPDLDRLVEVLRHERCLVVLDNCEHVLDQSAALAERLVEMTDHVVVLATSRERLAVDGERLVTVPPLSLTAGTASPATRLLIDRMVSVTGRAPDGDELEQLDELAGRLDGLPLALELAAARLQALTTREVLEGVEESIAVLRGGRRTVDRHRSVDAALSWSYDLLDERAKRALRAAATFSSRFAATDVAAVMEIDRSTAIDTMSILVERSMAQRDGERLALLHVVRRFAVEQTDDIERRGFLSRLSLRMRDVAEALRADLRTASDSAPIDGYIARMADFRRAIEVGLAANDADTVLRTVVSLRDLAFNSVSIELVRWCEDAAAAGAHVDHVLTVDAYAIAGLGAWKQSSLDDTRRLLSLAEQFCERRNLMPTYELLSAQTTEDLAHGELDRAIERLEQAMRLPGVVDDVIRRTETYGTLVICMAYVHRRDVVAVADAMVAAMNGERAAIAHSWCQYASGECRLDADAHLARQHLERAVALARAGGSTFLEGIAGASLASLDVRSSDLTSAIANYRWLLPMWLRAGMQSPFWTGMRSVVNLLMQAHETIAAVRLLGAVVSPGAGHDVFGDDVARLESMRTELEQRTGRDVFDAEFARGAELDEAAAAQEATAAFDRFAQSAL